MTANIEAAIEWLQTNARMPSRCALSSDEQTAFHVVHQLRFRKGYARRHPEERATLRRVLAPLQQLQTQVCPLRRALRWLQQHEFYPRCFPSPQSTREKRETAVYYTLSSCRKTCDYHQENDLVCQVQQLADTYPRPATFASRSSVMCQAYRWLCDHERLPDEDSEDQAERDMAILFEDGLPFEARYHCLLVHIKRLWHKYDDKENTYGRDNNKEGKRRQYK